MIGGGRPLLPEILSQSGHVGAKFEQKAAITPKRYEIGCQLQLIANMKSHTGFRLVPTSMTLNDLERRNSPYFAFFSRNLTDFQADYMTVVEDGPIMSVNHCLPVLVFYFWPKLLRTLQRCLSAIAEHLVYSAQRPDLFA